MICPYKPKGILYKPHSNCDETPEFCGYYRRRKNTEIEIRKQEKELEEMMMGVGGNL